MLSRVLLWMSFGGPSRKIGGPDFLPPPWTVSRGLVVFWRAFMVPPAALFLFFFGVAWFPPEPGGHYRRITLPPL